MGVQGILEKVRKWIDGEDDLVDQGKTRPHSKWEDFLVAIAREIEQTMQAEMFTPPGGPTYIPREYMVFLSPSDDNDWQGEKREGLERGLRHVLSERAKELAGANAFQTKTLTIELRVDAALEPGKFKVQPVWDAQTEKTIVTPRKQAAKQQSQQVKSAVPVDDEATVVRPRKQEPLFRILVRKSGSEGESLEPIAFYKNEVTIGRGSSQVDVDLTLEGDMEISRKHATVARNEDGSFTITCHGANPLIIDNSQEVVAGESVPIKPGQNIEICRYKLSIIAEPDGDDTIPARK